MGIKTANLVITSKQESQVEVQPVVTPVVENKPKINNLVVVNKKPEPVKEPSVKSLKGSKLVVDGKVKNISKKSAFLLDMLTLDDDQPK